MWNKLRLEIAADIIKARPLRERTFGDMMILSYANDVIDLEDKIQEKVKQAENIYTLTRLTTKNSEFKNNYADEPITR
jgi:hypothetical protein